MPDGDRGAEEVDEHAADLGGAGERDVIGLHRQRRVVGEARQHALDVHRVDGLEYVSGAFASISYETAAGALAMVTSVRSDV